MKCFGGISFRGNVQEECGFESLSFRRNTIHRNVISKECRCEETLVISIEHIFERISFRRDISKECHGSN